MPCTTEREQRIARETLRFALSALFTLPLLGNMVAELFGWRIFFLADAKIQFVWGTLVQCGTGWPFLAGAYRSLRSGRVLYADVLVTLGASSVYLYSVYNTFVNPVAVYFAAAAIAMTVAILVRLVNLVVQGTGRS